MFTVLALKPSIAGVVFIIAMIGFIVYFRFTDINPLFARKAVFVISILLVDALGGTILWGAAYSKKDYFTVAVYISLLAGTLFRLLDNTKSTTDPDPNPLDEPRQIITRPSKPEWFYKALVRCPQQVFVPLSLKEALNFESPRAIIIGPHGSGKETMAILWATARCEYVLKVGRSMLDEIVDSVQFVDYDNICIIIRDIHTFTNSEFESIGKLSKTSCRLIFTTTNFDILIENPIFSNFEHVYVPQLRADEIESCFRFFLAGFEIEDTNWVEVSRFLKICYIPTVKYICELALQYLEEDDNPTGVIKRIYLASALQRFLNEPI